MISSTLTYPSLLFQQHEKEIQNLMGALIYAADENDDAAIEADEDAMDTANGETRSSARLRDSPYAHLLAPEAWHEICEHFVRDACALMGLAIESPLSVVLNAGCAALPALLNIKQVD